MLCWETGSAKPTNQIKETCPVVPKWTKNGMTEAIVGDVYNVYISGIYLLTIEISFYIVKEHLCVSMPIKFPVSV